MYFIQMQAEALPVCEPNFEKLHFHKCYFGNDLGNKKDIYNNLYHLYHSH